MQMPPQKKSKNDKKDQPQQMMYVSSFLQAPFLSAGEWDRKIV